MNEQTIVAVYDTAAHADAAVRDLKAANVPANAISQHAKSGSMTGTERTEMVEPARRQGFWSSLFGGEPDYDTTVYDRSIDSGATVVTVRVPTEYFDRVSNILETHNPIDLDERAAQYGTGQTTTARTTAAPAYAPRGAATGATDGGTMQLSEETLSVGKRAVSGGTTRIRRYVVETPVEKQVNLHSERVTVDRRPVTDARPASNANFADNDKTIEMTETSEEAVVSKTARVKEEVSLRKEASDRVETVKDTVRREDVDIEQVPGGQTKTASSRTPGGSERQTPPAQRRA